MRIRRIGVFWVKLAAFLCLLAMMCNAVGHLLSGDIDTTKQANTLRHLPRGSVDVLWVGSSHMFCGVIPQMLYDEYGIASAMLSMESMSVSQMYWGMKEALLRQSPRVAVVELYTAAAPYCYGQEINAMALKRVNPKALFYVNFGQMARWLPLGSPYKPFAISEVKRQYDIIPTEVFEITKMHNRYKDIRQSGFLAARARNEYALDFGTRFLCHTLNPDKVARADYTQARATQTVQEDVLWQFTEEQLAEAALLPEMRQDLERIIRLTRERGIELVFCVMPYMMNAAEEKLFQELKGLAEEEDIAFVGPDAVPMGYDSLADMGHLNADGALRYTAFWGEELSRRFDLPDRRQSADCRYAAWREHPGRYLAQIAARRKYDAMSDYLEMLTTLDEDSLILLGFQGPVYDRFTEDDHRLLVEELGISEETLAQWYDTGEGTLNVLIHNKQVLASSYAKNDWEAELRWDAFGNAVSINGGRHRVNRKQPLNNAEDGLHATVFSLSGCGSLNSISFDLTQIDE